MMKRVEVFGVPIHGASLRETLDLVQRQTTHTFWIVTANPEILLAARRDPSYAKILRRADLCLVDGFGLWLLLRIFGYKTHRVTGVDLAELMIQFSVQNDFKLAFLGSGIGIAERAAQKTRNAYPSVRIFVEQGGIVQQDGSIDAAGEEALSRLIQWSPEILFVAFGHPKQERWIERRLEGLPNTRVVVGIGGTFDYWAEAKKRAPMWMRSFGLEWVWRLIHEPRRWNRMADAVILFPLFFLIDRFHPRAILKEALKRDSRYDHQTR